MLAKRTMNGNLAVVTNPGIESVHWVRDQNKINNKRATVTPE